MPADPLRAALAAGGHAARRARLRRPDRLALPPRGPGLARRTRSCWPRSGSRWCCWRSSCSPRRCSRSSGPACPTSWSWSTTRPAQQIADQYENPKTKAAAGELARADRQAGERTEPSRLAVARAGSPQDDGQLLRELQKQNKVRLYLVSTSAAAAGRGGPARGRRAGRSRSSARSRPTGGQTRLGDGVRQVLTELRGAPPSAILLLTDGQTTDGEPLAKAAEFAARKGVPLYTIGLGSPEPARDLELTELLVDDVVFVDDLVRFQAKLSARGFAGPGGHGPAQGARRRLGRPQGRPRARDRSGSTAPPDGQPKRVEVGHRPKRDRRDHLHPRGRAPAPRAPDREQPDRAHRQRPQGEAQGPARRQRAALRVPLPEELPRTRGDDRPERRPALVRPRVQRAGPLGPADLPGGQGRAVRLRRRAHRRRRPELPEPSQMQNLAEFVTEKGGGVLFIAGENFNPLSYRGTPLELLLPIELAEARNPTAVGNAIDRVPARADREGRASPIFRFGDDEATSAQIWQNLPELFWYLEAPRKKPAALVLAEHPTLTGSDGKLPIYPLPVRRRRQGDVQRRRRHLAVAVPRRRPLLRPVLDPDDPVPGPLEAARPEAGRDPDRPPPLPAEPADPDPGPVPQPGHRADAAARSTSRSSARGRARAS